MKMKVTICDFCRKIPKSELETLHIIKISYGDSIVSIFKGDRNIEICDICFEEMLKYIRDKVKN